MKAVGLRPRNISYWETNKGSLPVTLHLIELASSSNNKTKNPVRIRIGFEINNQRRMDLVHESGTRSIEVFPVNTHGKLIMNQRRFIEVPKGEKERVFHLPAGKYSAMVLANSGKADTWGFETLKFEVIGNHDPSLVPKLPPKNARGTHNY